jgi:excisionase family DNA binding protein
VTDQPESLDGELLTLQEAADRLRVHYMTAYRWVRRGELPAFKAGGRLRVRGSDLNRFLADREVDVAMPTLDPGRTDWPTHVARLTELLLEGKAVDAGGLVRKVVADGAPVGDVYIHLLAPALHLVGEEWAAGRIGVAQEHRASAIASGVMARLSENFRRRGVRRGTAVTLSLPGDQHGLGAAMVADFLRAGGYEVHYLGAGVDAEELRVFLQIMPVDVVAVSITVEDVDPEILRRMVTMVGDSDSPGATVMSVVVIGGQGASPELAQATGALHVGDLEDLAGRLSDLVSD